MKDFFVRHRERLGTELHGGLVVVAAYTRLQRTNDVAFRFEQEANFWWLSGIEAPDWWLIFDGARGKSWLVAPARDNLSDIFDGGVSNNEAVVTSGVDKIITQDEAMNLLRDLAKKHSIVYTIGEQSFVKDIGYTPNPAPKRMYDMLARLFNAVQDCRKDINRLRAIKEPEELVRIKKSVDLAVKAFQDLRPRLAQFQYEYEIEAELNYFFRTRGLRGYSYVPVVASGKNACLLHYTANQAKLKKQALLLLDTAFVHNGYAASIARTYAPTEPTKRQVAVHAAVQAAHRHIIRLLKPHLLIEDYQRQVDDIMRHTLRSLGLNSDEPGYHMYFPHAVSHGLGVDVHDSLGMPRFFQPGMVVTVEPGVYIPQEGIGVRMCDDIVITKQGHTTMSARLSTDL